MGLICCNPIQRIVTGVWPVDPVDPPVELALYMLFDDIVNAPVADPTNVADWDAFYGTTFTSVTVTGNEVELFGGVDVVIAPFLFNGSTSILAIIDYVDCVIEVGASAFNDCFNLFQATLNSAVTVGDNAFLNCVGLITGQFDAATSVGVNSFSPAPLTTDASFDSLVEIGDGAFSLCAFTAVNFDNVTTVGTTAFIGCPNFTNPSFPLCNSSGTDAFSGSGCETISFPLLVDIPNSMCAQCTSLTTASFPIAETAGFQSFYQSGLTTIDFPELTTAGDQTWSLCEAATSVNLPNLTIMGASCMAGLNSLVTLLLPSLIEGGDDCLSSNLLLSVVELPVATDLGDLNIFADCPALTSLDIASMTAITGNGTPFSQSTEIIFVNMPTITDDTSGGVVVANCVGNIITVNVNAVLETIDGGNPAPWIVTMLADNPGSTVNYIP